MRRETSILNGKRGGRPSAENIKGNRKIFEFPEFNTVILTESQYDTLLEKYGSVLLNKALEILSGWFSTSPVAKKYKGRNNYALFRSDGWLINESKLSQ